MSQKLVGNCQKCKAQRLVSIVAYPYTNATNQTMVQVVALCAICDAIIDFNWTSLRLVFTP